MVPHCVVSRLMKREQGLRADLRHGTAVNGNTCGGQGWKYPRPAVPEEQDDAERTASPVRSSA